MDQHSKVTKAGVALLFVSMFFLALAANDVFLTDSFDCQAADVFISEAIHDAGHCTKDTDCGVEPTVAEPRCGCPAVINVKADISVLTTKITEFRQQCLEKDMVCEPCFLISEQERLTCDNGHCAVVNLALIV